jgi:hypothetical protein
MAFLGSASLIFLSCAALPACGQQDEKQAVMAQCGDPAPRDIDACLERARVLNETDPSPDVQALVARLIQKQVQFSEPPPPTIPPDAQPSPDDNGVSSYDTTPPLPPPSDDLGPQGTYQPPPDAAPAQEAPPDVQGNPSDIGPPDAGPASPGDPNAPPPPPDSGPH